MSNSTVPEVLPRHQGVLHEVDHGPDRVHPLRGERRRPPGRQDGKPGMRLLGIDGILLTLHECGRPLAVDRDDAHQAKRHNPHSQGHALWELWRVAGWEFSRSAP